MSESVQFSKTAPREQIYAEIAPQIEALIAGERDTIAKLANVAAQGSPISVMRAPGACDRKARSAGTAHSMSPSCSARKTAMRSGGGSHSSGEPRIVNRES